MKEHKIIAIIPAYNESKNIANVLSDIYNCQIKMDPVVIDDGSSDGTAEIARQEGAEVIPLPFNLGIGGAVQTGFKYAKREGYDIAVQIDADGQHIPEQVAALINPIVNEEADVVIGSRYLNKNRSYNTPVSRRIGMVIFSFVNSLIIKQKITDNTSGFRAYNSDAIEFLSRNYPLDYPEVEAVAVLGKNNFRIVEVPVQMRRRNSGESSITPVKSIYYMIKVLLGIFVNLCRSTQGGRRR